MDSTEGNVSPYHIIGHREHWSYARKHYQFVDVDVAGSEQF
jgi:hypothetical protein